LLEASIDGAFGVLLSVSGGSDLGLFEINEAANLVAQAAHDEANIIFGAVIDDALGDEVRVTVIAAGFDGATHRRRDLGAVRRTLDVGGADGRRPAPPGDDPHAPEDPGAPRRAAGDPAVAQVRTGAAPTSAGPGAGPAGSAVDPRATGSTRRDEVLPPRRVVPDRDDDLDVPDFLK
jgi:cell division protein FtsZ